MGFYYLMTALDFERLMVSIGAFRRTVEQFTEFVKQAERDAIMTPMPYRGEDMTVAELIDLVEFLHSHYTRLQPNYYHGYYLTD